MRDGDGWNRLSADGVAEFDRREPFHHRPKGQIVHRPASRTPLRRTAALAGLGLTGIGLAAGLAGCAPSTSAEGDAAASGDYADGDYSAEGSYMTPGGESHVDVSVTLADNVVEAVTVESATDIPESQQYQSQFISGIEAEVVGKNIDELDVSRIAGSSLTSQGFNAAIETIKSEAAA